MPFSSRAVPAAITAAGAASLELRDRLDCPEGKNQLNKPVNHGMLEVDEPAT